MNIQQLCTWLINTVTETKDGKVGLILHVKNGKISFERIHNTKGDTIDEKK